MLTDPVGKHLLVVDVALHPTHQMVDIVWRGHLGGPFELLAVLPKVFESCSCEQYLKSLSHEYHTHRSLSFPDTTAESRIL